MAAVGLNEILVVSKAPDANIAIQSDLYDIESTNTTEIRTQSVSTATGNEHTIQKSSNEGLVATKIAGGTLEFVTDNSSTQVAQTRPLIIGFVIMGQ
ncbi:hypothetical protein R9X47_04025 [Wukongibacter baidiensis]|uniref:hypothetical protein n=1 Tax=Wukongibacter baidiensis TaxID=1723361 RepID=UPI003D7FA759